MKMNINQVNNFTDMTLELSKNTILNKLTGKQAPVLEVELKQEQAVLQIC